MSRSDPLPRRGAGIVLRRLAASDLAAFQAYRTDPEVGLYQGWTAQPEAEARAFLDEMHSVPLLAPGRWTQLAIATPGDLALLGDVGLYVAADSRSAEIGFTLSRPAQGRGLAQAAVREAAALVFELTAAERVLGITDARNAASIRVLERVGMHRVETRETTFRGAPCVEHVYALARPASR